MKWPALYGRRSGHIKIANFAIDFTSEEGYGVEIPLNQLVIKIRGTNSPSYQLCDRYNEQIKFVIQDREPLEILARRGIQEAKVALRKNKRKWSFKILRYAAPLLLIAGLIIGFPAALTVAPAEWLDFLVSPALEKKLGTRLFDYYRDEFKIDLQSPAQKPLQELVDHMVKSNRGLAAHSPRIFVSSSPELNALTLAGGIIVCNRGLLDRAESVEEIAGVLAHELGHVELRHVTRGILSSLGTTGVFVMLSAFIGGNTASLIDSVAGLLRLKFSRAQEQRADDKGFTILVKAGISPRGMIGFFNKLVNQAPTEINLAFLSTHPLTGERIEAIGAKLQGYKDTEWSAPPVTLDRLRNKGKR